MKVNANWWNDQYKTLLDKKPKQESYKEKLTKAIKENMIGNYYEITEMLKQAESTADGLYQKDLNEFEKTKEQFVLNFIDYLHKYTKKSIEKEYIKYIVNKSIEKNKKIDFELIYNDFVFVMQTINYINDDYVKNIKQGVV